MTNFQLLTTFGWAPFFQQQLTLQEWDDAIPARVIEQYRSRVRLISDQQELDLDLTPNTPPLVVGDWILLNQSHQFSRLLDRKTCFKRKAAGTALEWQLISANVDTAFIVCSLNEDFNLNRIERYWALANAAEVEPIVVLTKSDLTDAAEQLRLEVQSLDPLLSVVCVNALSTDSIAQLSDWLKPGKTIVLLGSSGVGKSTLSNTLLGQDMQSTGGIREDDGKGRHTTTSRSLLLLPDGGLILDTPGMRELQIADCQDGISSTFTDIENLARECRFADCQHLDEPNCAVQRAVAEGELEQRRLSNYHKLMREEANNTATLSEKRAKDKSFGKFIKQTLKESYKLKGRQ